MVFRNRVNARSVLYGSTSFVVNRHHHAIGERPRVLVVQVWDTNRLGTVSCYSPTSHESISKAVLAMDAHDLYFQDSVHGHKVTLNSRVRGPLPHSWIPWTTPAMAPRLTTLSNDALDVPPTTL